MKQRIYIDTSVIGGCMDEEFAHWSKKLISEFKEGLRIALISSLTRSELEKAPVEVRDVISSIPPTNIENVTLTDEAETLAEEYLKAGAVGRKHFADAQHIAIATIARVDVLVSWNFQQIVNLKRIRSYNSVNLRLGHALLEIRSPREVVHDEEV